MELPQIENYRQIFTDDIPLLDVRAPVEFKQGAFPLAKNLPLLNDDERQAIGLRYKEHGQQAAIAFGHQLVSGEIKHNRISAWSEFSSQFPTGALYCFRGGLRSKISQQWLYDKTGLMYPRIKGGYKALRRYLIEELDISAKQTRPLLLSGRTGVGKTLLLNNIQQKIDLEAIYKHRGSAFGKQITTQPSQIDIENNLSILLLKHRNIISNKIVFEDEAANIGSRRLPESLIQAMQKAPLILLETGIIERTNIVFDEYIVKAIKEYQNLYGTEEGENMWENNLRSALLKIQRRLGGVHYKTILSTMDYAFKIQSNRGDLENHKNWIADLLVGYYDPMYDYQLNRKKDRIIFQGDRLSVLEYLHSNHQISGL